MKNTPYSVTVAKRLLNEALNIPGMNTNGPQYAQVSVGILNSLIKYVESLEKRIDELETPPAD